MKDFDTWNEVKKEHELSLKRRFYKTREIWWCALGINIGFEQCGTGTRFDRPVLILKSFSKNTCLIIPLTTSKKNNRYSISLGLIKGKKSKILISQIRIIDTKRLINRITLLDKKTFEAIRKIIKDML